MDTERYQQTERTRVRRLPERAAYDRDTVHAILDEGFICHVGFVVDGRPFVIPTGYARAGETLYRLPGPAPVSDRTCLTRPLSLNLTTG